MKDDTPMKPEDRDALMLKVSNKMKEMSDEDLMDLAKEAGVDDTDTAPDDSAKPMPESTDVVKPVDTSLLTGPMPALKNFLVQRQRDNESQ